MRIDDPHPGVPQVLGDPERVDKRFGVCVVNPDSYRAASAAAAASTARPPLRMPVIA